jgi:hypothetical protein
MTRKFSAALSALALALCFSRGAAWAAAVNHRDAPACCRHCAPTKAAISNDCCPATAAAGAVRVARVDAPAVVVAPAVLPAARELAFVVPHIGSPPGSRTYRAAAPARAPPLA